MVKNSIVIKYIIISLTLGLLQNLSIKSADFSQSLTKEVLFVNYVKRNKIEEVKELLKPENNQINNIDVNAKDDDQTSVIFHAIENENLEMTKLLLDHADINFNVKCADMNILQFAIYKDNIDLIKLVLKYSAIDVNAKDDNGDTALHKSIFVKNIDLIKLLLAHPKINIHIQDENSRTALELAKFWDDAEVIKLIENYFWSNSNCSIQ